MVVVGVKLWVERIVVGWVWDVVRVWEACSGDFGEL